MEVHDDVLFETKSRTSTPAHKPSHLRFSVEKKMSSILPIPVVHQLNLGEIMDKNLKRYLLVLVHLEYHLPKKQATETTRVRITDKTI